MTSGCQTSMGHSGVCDSPSANRYKSAGCRCDGCREAQRETMRDYYRRVGGNRHRKPEHEARSRVVKKARGYTDTQRERDQRRRARKAGVNAERVDRLTIYARDAWTCGICSEPVDRTAQHPDPRSASLDHIVPLSLGGHHTSTNVRLTHLDCNVKRGNRAA